MELFHDTETKKVLCGQVSDNTAQVGAIIDHQNARDALYQIVAGTLADADATFTVLLEEGDASDMSDAAAVADVHLIGTENGAAFQFDDDNETRKLGYIGTKRYTRLTITPANNTGAADIAAVCTLSGLRKSVTAQAN